MESAATNGKALIDAIESFAFSDAVKLLKKGSSFPQDVLDTALMLTCQLGHKFLVQALVRCGANVENKDANGNTALMICAKNGFTDVVHFLLGKVDVNAVNSAGDTALILSVHSSGSTEITQLLLARRRLDFSHQNKDGYTALMKASEKKDIDTFKLLLSEYAVQIRFQRVSGKAIPKGGWNKLLGALNNKHENVFRIAEKYGLLNVVNLLKIHEVSSQKAVKKSRLMALKSAMDTGDARSFSVLLDCEFVQMNPSLSVNQLLKSVFLKLQADVNSHDGHVTIIDRLLECGADVNISWSDTSHRRRVVDNDNDIYDVNEIGKITERSVKVRVTPLNIAAAIGSCELVKLLLKYGALITTYFPTSPLEYALRHGYSECAQILIQHGAAMDIKCALVSAVHLQIPKYLCFLYENYKDEIVNMLRMSARNPHVLLKSAVRGGNFEIITELLNIVSCCYVKLPLEESKDGDVARFLINRGANVNAMTKSCGHYVSTLIHVLENREYNSPTLEVIKVLLDHGASVNDRNFVHQTPLMIAAAKEDNIGLMKMLLDHRADISLSDSEGNTVLHAALQEIYPHNASFLIRYSENIANVLDVQNDKGFTPLMCAIINLHIDLVTQLLERGVDVNIKDKDGNTALCHGVSRLCDEEYFLALINAGADVNTQNNDGLSPLMLATKNCYPDAVLLLLNNGASVNAVSEQDNQKTAISFIPDKSACGMDVINCVIYLLEGGAHASYVSPSLLLKAILYHGEALIPKLIRGGLGPEVKGLHEAYPEMFFCQHASNVSPLSLAFSTSNRHLAEYFIANNFLTKSDVKRLSSDINLRLCLRTRIKAEHLNFCDEISLWPMSLFNLASVSVSCAIGAVPGRENRINALPIPQMIKDRLLFRSELFTLNISDEADGGLVTSSIAFLDDFTPSVSDGNYDYSSEFDIDDDLVNVYSYWSDSE